MSHELRAPDEWLSEETTLEIATERHTEVTSPPTRAGMSSAGGRAPNQTEFQEQVHG